MKSWRMPPQSLAKLAFCGLLALFGASKAAAQTEPPRPLPATKSAEPKVADSPRSPAQPKLPQLPQPLPSLTPKTPSSPKPPPQASRGSVLLEEAIRQLVNGPPLEIKMRQRVMVSDRLVMGVGRYIQAGGGQGRYRNEMVLPLGDTRCILVQINDGHLAWSSQKLGEDLKVWRVNVLRLDELVPDGASRTMRPSLRVIGLAELLDGLARDYDLQTARGVLKGEEVDIARGALNDAARHRLMAARGNGAAWPEYLPNYVVIALSQQTTPAPHLPVRIEYWLGDPHQSDPRLPMAQRVGMLECLETRLLEQVDEQIFEFAADRIPDYEDRTAEYVERLGLDTAGAPQLTRLPEMKLRR